MSPLLKQTFGEALINMDLKPSSWPLYHRSDCTLVQKLKFGLGRGWDEMQFASYEDLGNGVTRTLTTV
jgi:hypothetical protein